MLTFSKRNNTTLFAPMYLVHIFYYTHSQAARVCFRHIDRVGKQTIFCMDREVPCFPSFLCQLHWLSSCSDWAQYGVYAFVGWQHSWCVHLHARKNTFSWTKTKFDTRSSGLKEDKIVIRAASPNMAACLTIHFRYHFTIGIKPITGHTLTSKLPLLCPFRAHDPALCPVLFYIVPKTVHHVNREHHMTPLMPWVECLGRIEMFILRLHPVNEKLLVIIMTTWS